MQKQLATFFSLFTLVAVGCGPFGSQRPSILVIAADSLPVNKVTCEVELKSNSGFKTLCQEAVRFTHAYTPSAMSQPAMISLLSARYPHEHGVWDNGKSFLSAKVETVTEAAVKKGYRTAYFAGGPPLYSKSGHGQGFEYYAEASIEYNRLYWAAKPNFKRFLTWTQLFHTEKPFFAVVHLSDLQFIDTPTTNDQGELRENSYSSQLEEIDESLGYLIKEMRKRKIWDNTYVLLVGLNGKTSRARLDEMDGYNLYSENAQVALLIKPARKKRDLGVNWTVDRNVSLVDVGVTLLDLLEAPTAKRPPDSLSLVSLRSVLEGPEANWSNDRLLLTESAWSQWKNMGNTRFSMRAGHLLYFHQKPEVYFNTLIDRNESVPIETEEESEKKIIQEIRRFFDNAGFSKWTGLPKSYVEKLQIAAELWRAKEIESTLYSEIRILSGKRPWDLQILGWRAVLAAENKEWNELRELGKLAKEPLWVFVADTNLGKKPKLPEHPCFQFINKEVYKDKESVFRTCEDDLYLKLLSWLHEKRETKKAISNREEFLRQYRYFVIDRAIARYNYVNGLLWDVSEFQPQGPSLTELALALPKYKGYSNIVKLRLEAKN